MAAPPALKRLLMEQYEDAPEWFQAFLQAFNPFATDVVNGLTRSLTYGDNIYSEEREFRVVTGDPVDADESPFPLYLKPQLVRHPRNFIVTDVRPVGVNTPLPISATQAFCTMTADGRVKVRWISGLDVNTTYDIRIRFD